MKCFAKIAVFTKFSMIDVWQGFECISDIYFRVAVAQRNHQLLPRSRCPTFTCHETYKLQATLNITVPISKTIPVIAYSLICVSAYENLVCTKTTDADWKQGQCLVGGSEIECPLFETNQTYSDFMLWKITTFIVKIGYTINGEGVHYYWQTNNTLLQMHWHC